MRYVIFDLETAPIDDAGTYVEPATAPSNYKDPVKIAEYIREAEASAVAKCALDPDLCRIVALGVSESDNHAPPVVYPCFDVAGERHALECFWQIAARTTLVGFNCLTFDLPVILRRSLYLGVKAPSIQIDKYRHPDVIDLMQLLSFNGAIKAHSLAFYTNRFGLPVVQDDVTGADIGQLVQEGKWDAIEQHCRADVLRTKALALRVGAIPAHVEAVA